MHTHLVNEAQMILFQIARKLSSEHNQNTVSSNRALSKSLAEATLKKAKETRPDIDSKIWTEAARKMAEI